MTIVGRRSLRWHRAALIVLLAGFSSGCAQAINYLNPSGPHYQWNLGPSLDNGECAEPTRAFTVATFNIQYAKKVDLAIDALRSTPVLRDLDVLLIQEMDAPGVERIAATLGLNALYFPSGVHPRTHREFGTAVLSRWPLEDGRKVVLPHESFGTGLIRAATAGTVICGSHRIDVMSVHLPSPAGVSYDERREQVEVLLASVAAIDGALVIGGDFNASWVGSLFEDAGFTWLNEELAGTRSLLGFGLKLDHVFVRGLSAADAGPAAGVADARGASDHKPLWVRLQLAPQPDKESK